MYEVLFIQIRCADLFGSILLLGWSRRATTNGEVKQSPEKCRGEVERQIVWKPEKKERKVYLPSRGKTGEVSKQFRAIFTAWKAD